MILLNLCFLAVKAQEMPEVYLLWPDGPEENNGLADQEITESNGNITFNSTAKLHVYHPEKRSKTESLLSSVPEEVTHSFQWNMKAGCLPNG